MAENGRFKRFLGHVGSLILTLIAAALIYLAAVLLQSPGSNQEEGYIVQEDIAPVTRMQAATMNDAAALARMFENRLPALEGFAPNGQGVNTAHDGGVARLVTLSYNGVTISAVRPATAAPLILHKDLDIVLRSDLTVLNLPAMLASRGSAFCLYFSDESASYAVYAPQAEEEAFLALIPRLSWVNP
ncbi:MAG: hypothetical protein IJ189_05500 [Clostridia bacterium]|nr:hypothetical protein [Clostridia bacterium]